MELEHLALWAEPHLVREEDRHKHHRENKAGNDAAIVPITRDATPLQGEDEDARPPHSDNRASPITPPKLAEHNAAVSLVRRLHTHGRPGRLHDRLERERNTTKRQVDVEAPAPRHVVGERAADERTDDTSDGEAHADDGHVLCAVVEWGDLGYDDHGPAEDACCAGAGDGAAKNQDVHAGRDAADERAELEDEDGEHDDVFGGEDLEELGVDEVEGEEGEAGVSE